MAYTSSDKVDHSMSIFAHLERMSIEVSQIFKKEYKEGNIHGALPSSKIENWKAMVQWFESLMIPYLGIPYRDRSIIIREQYANAWKKKDLQGCFEAMNELAQILMLEASTNGFLLKPNVTGEWIAKSVEEQDDEQVARYNQTARVGVAVKPNLGKAAPRQ